MGIIYNELRRLISIHFYNLTCSISRKKSILSLRTERVTTEMNMTAYSTIPSTYNRSKIFLHSQSNIISIQCPAKPLLNKQGAMLCRMLIYLFFDYISINTFL